MRDKRGLTVRYDSNLKPLPLRDHASGLNGTNKASLSCLGGRGYDHQRGEP